MRKILISILVVILFFATRSYGNSFSVSGHTCTINPTYANMTISFSDISNLKIKQIEKLLGRRLKLKEKIAVKLYQWKLKREARYTKSNDYKDKGKTAMIFGIIGLASLLLAPISFFGVLPSIAFGLAALLLGKKVKKENSADKKAKTAIILGWITLGVLTAVAIFIVIFLASINWGIK